MNTRRDTPTLLPPESGFLSRGLQTQTPDLQACVDMESLKQYVDENVSDLKDFIASVAKKLPMPVKFTTEEKHLGPVKSVKGVGQNETGMFGLDIGRAEEPWFSAVRNAQRLGLCFIDNDCSRRRGVFILTCTFVASLNVPDSNDLQN